MAITARQVKELRDRTGVGMMDCKRALEEATGDMDAAIDLLRKKGQAKAIKKAGRTAANGLVSLVLSEDQTRGVLIEVNTETDFVARNERFQHVVCTIAALALETGEGVEALLARACPGEDTVSVADKIRELVASIGENIALRRIAHLSVEAGTVGGYMHGAVAPGIGQTGALVALNSDPASAGADENVRAFAKHLAMQVVAARPEVVAGADIPLDAVEKERALLREQAEGEGRPAGAIDRIVEGRLNKFRKDLALLDQDFIIESPAIEGKGTVGKALSAIAEQAGAHLSVTGLVRLDLGEGIEQGTGDFAAEVAAMAHP